jgi:hypothetical protein
MFSVDLSLALAALPPVLPASTVVAGRPSRSALPPSNVGEPAKLGPALPRNSDQTAIEIMRLVQAGEAAPVPRREIVVPLFDNNNIFDQRKRKENRDE